MYYPVQGMLRGTLISDGHRATVKSFYIGKFSPADTIDSQVSALFRVPLNVFVVTSLLTGVGTARNVVLSACSAILGFSAVMTGLVIVRTTSETPHSENLRPA